MKTLNINTKKVISERNRTLELMGFASDEMESTIISNHEASMGFGNLVEKYRGGDVFEVSYSDDSSYQNAINNSKFGTFVGEHK